MEEPPGVRQRTKRNHCFPLSQVGQGIGLPAHQGAVGIHRGTASRYASLTSGMTPRDSEDTLRFAELSGVRPMIETYPLEKAAEGLRANDERRRTVPRRADDVKLADKYETHCESLLTNALTNATNGM